MRRSFLRVELPAAPATVRERELEVGRLVLRAVRTREPFLVARADAAVAGLGAGPAKRALQRAVVGTAAPDGRTRDGLLAYGAVLERHGLHPAAAEIYGEVLDHCGGGACVALHAGRAARKSGERARALSLYRRAAEVAGGDRHVELLARIGEALVSDSPLGALRIAVQAARRAGDLEALAVAREERARLHVEEGRTGAAVRDLAAAAARYPDASDRIRVLHALADLLIARADLAGAREALLAALDQGVPSARPHTVQRLRTVARALGDELELRRTRGQGTPALVTLVPTRRALLPPSRSLAPRLRRWRSLLSR